MSSRKTAIEECIERKPMNWTPLEDARDRRAMAELRALLRLAKVVNPWIVTDLAAMAQEGRAVLRLRRLGVLPEVSRG